MSETFTPEGAPIPAGIPQSRIDSSAAFNKNSLHRGFVTRAVYPTDDDNLTGFLEYIVLIEGQEYFGVLDMTDGGGIFNTHTRVRQGYTNADVRLTPNTSADAYDERKDGEFVWCLFIKGDQDFPIIVGSDIHVRTPKTNPDWIEPTKDLGVYERKEFNGLEFLIDKEGNFSLTHLNRKILPPKIGDLPLPADPSLVPYKGSFYKILNDGTIEIELKPTTKLLINPVTNVVEIENGLGTKFQMDGQADSFKFTNSSGMEAAYEGLTTDKFSFNTVTGTKLEVCGAADDTVNIEAAFGDKLSVSAADGVQASTPTGTSLSMKAGVVEMEGTGGKLKLGANMVGLGGASAELLDLLDQTIDQTIAFSTAAAAEVPTGNLGFPVIPDLAAKTSYGMVTMQLGIIKGLLATIKGGV